MNDDILMLCNETELLQMARAQGLGTLKYGLPKETLVAIVRGEMDPTPEHLSQTAYTRKKLEDYIAQNWEKVRSQLPGCNGKCTTFPCTEGRHLACFAPNEDGVQ